MLDALAAARQATPELEPELALAISGIAYAAGTNPHRRLRLIVPPIPAERLGSETRPEGM